MTKKKSSRLGELSPILMASIFIIFIVAMIFFAYFGMNLQSPVAKYFSSYNNKIGNDLTALIGRQREMDNKILDLSENGGYTFDKPLIFKAPYEINKTSAIIIFNTDEETAIKVELNGMQITTVKKSKKHIIPIYQLYADSSNYITLTKDNGDKQTFNIIVEPYNNGIQELKIGELIGDYKTYYLVGDLNADISSLRGFDSKGNLMSYYEFQYFSGATLFKNKISVGYKQSNKVVNDLRLDMDYMGRISNITSNTSEIQYEVNISGDGISYIGSPYNMYAEEIDNYSFTDLTTPDTYTTKAVLNMSEYDHLLSNSVKYDGEFEVNLMNDYISYKTDTAGRLLVVDRHGKLYSYPIDKSGIIKTDIMGKKSLYLSKDGVIYNLKTTLED